MIEGRNRQSVCSPCKLSELCFSREAENPTGSERKISMFQHLLVPLDGSSCAEQVLPVAARLVRASGGTITLLKIVRLAPEAASYRMEGPFLPQTLFKQDLAEARDYLDHVSQRSELAGIILDKQVDLGDPAATLLSHVEQQSIDLVVMSSHGYTGMKRWLLGSVAEKIARYTPAPVLILRKAEPLRTHIRFDGMCAVRALVPLDTSARSQDVIPPAAALVSALSSPEHGHLQLTHVVVLPEDAGEAEKEALLREAGQYLDAVGRSIREGLAAQGGRDLHLTFSWAVSIDSDIAEGIVRMAENGEQSVAVGSSQRCDLIAMTTHGAAGLHRWAVGSITERVLHATRLPLLIVRPADMIEKERRQQESRTIATK